MEEKVEAVLKLLHFDGDSFVKRAELFYKGRPELVSFVEESYRAYRALAERYDHISKELQNANNTIASICPEQVPFMDEDDEDGTPRAPRKANEGYKANVAPASPASPTPASPSSARAPASPPSAPASSSPASPAPAPAPALVPNVPKPPAKDLKSVITSATKKFVTKKTPAKTRALKEPVKSGLSKKQALKEIDKLQKRILALQTVKEFLKSSYDNAIAKYWDTEEEIKELQEKVSRLQDEFGEGMVIEDDEARRLMTEAALQKCQETLTRLVVNQEREISETKIERKRVKAIKEKLEGLMQEFHYDQIIRKVPKAKKDVKKVENVNDMDEDVELERMTQQRQELQLLQDKIKEQFEAGAYSSMNVTEMAEKINELVNKVVSLESSVSSQDALVTRLRTETDELQSEIQKLEDDKASLINEKTGLNKQLKAMDEKMQGIQDLNQMVESQNSNLQTHFTEVRSNLDALSNVQNANSDEEDKAMDSSERESKSSSEVVGQDDASNQEHVLNDVKSSKKLKVAVMVDNDAQKDTDDASNQEHVLLKEVKSKSSKKLKVAVMVDNDVQKDNKNEVTDLVNDVPKDNEIKVAESVENYTKSDNKLKVMGLLEKEEACPTGRKSPTQLNAIVRSASNATTGDQDLSQHKASKEANTKLKVMGSLEKEEACPVESKSPTQLNAIARSASNATAGDQDLSQHKASKEANSFSETSGNQQEKSANQILSVTVNAHEVHSQEQVTAQDEPDWRQLFTDGMQDREKALLSEYTNSLRNYKEMKKKLIEVEKKNQESLFDISLKLKELKNSNALKDEEIKLLRRKLGLMERSLEGNEDLVESKALEEPAKEEDDEMLTSLTVPQPDSTSAIEEKFRRNIDEILEENLGFWMKFSTTFTEIHKFQTTIKDLQSDVSKLEERGKSESVRQSVKSDARPIFKHLAEIQTELTVWLDKSASLKEELRRRSSSLNAIQEEITQALKASAEDDDFKFTSYQAAKFQGEVLNMKQENNKVANELQVGRNHVSALVIEVEKDLAKMGEQFGLSSTKSPQNRPIKLSDGNRSSVPLGAFIFGVKPKKQKHSIFSSITPGINKKSRASKGQSLL